jgi:hypothetical protein
MQFKPKEIFKNHSSLSKQQIYCHVREANIFAFMPKNVIIIIQQNATQEEKKK